MKPLPMAIGLAFLAGLLAMAFLVPHNPETGVRPVRPLACPDLAKGCAVRAGDVDIKLGITGGARALKPFQLWVKAPGARQIEASFVMVDMNMGINRYRLRPAGGGVFQAQVTLPLCVSGRRDWVMTLDIDHAIRLAVPFTATL